MKQVKKMMCGWLAVLLVCVVPMTVSAADPVTVTFEQESAKAGDTFTATVSLSENSGVCAMDVFMTYDSSRVSVEDAVVGNFVENGIVNTKVPGQVYFVFASLDALTSSKPFLTVTFKALTDITPGDDSVTLVIDGLYDYDAKNLPVKFSGTGGVKVTSNMSGFAQGVDTVPEGAINGIGNTVSGTQENAVGMGTELQGVYTGNSSADNSSADSSPGSLSSVAIVIPIIIVVAAVIVLAVMVRKARQKQK